MKTKEKMVDEVYQWLLDEGEKSIEYFCATEEKNLISYHNSLGRAIRNHFEMWKHEWEPEIVNGVDHSPNHPDQISFEIIKGVWKKANEQLTSL